ncbi:MAG TPA: sigma-70 family RNA polymerase sigma factor [Gemmataceae bacterium]|nr:sigma-70 family RNA polymerase sigma factor [Gemmataceae bacterium]
MAHRTTTVSHLARALAAGEAEGSDCELLARFVADGDQAAFAALAARHAGMVLGVCRRALPRAADAEDACQAVFLLLAQKAARVRWRSSVAGWLYTAARRVARNARRSAERRARREARAAVPEAVAPVDAMTGRELAAVLDDELGRLPPRYRDPLVLCCLEGLAQDEAAARLGVPIETLRTRLQRGRKRLAAALAARGCDLGIALLAVAASAAGAMAARLEKAIRAAGAGSASPSAIALARGAAHPLLSPFRSVMLAISVAAAALGLGVALSPRVPAQPPKEADQPAVEKASALATFGAGRFRANAPVGDARYSSDGKRIVAYAGSTLYVWDAIDGSLLRTMDSKIGPVPEPGWPYERDRAFAAHPKKPLVAFGGVRDEKTVLQVWDFESGKLVAETESPCRGLRVLAWTPDGTRLLERTADRWDQRGANVGGGFQPDNKPRLIVRDAGLKELRRHELPRAKYGEDHSVLMHPLPNGKEVLHWQSGTDPTIFDLDTGRVVRPLGYKSTALPSGLNITPDGKTAIITCSELISLVDMSDGSIRHQLPILRGGWERPRPLFSPDGRTVYIFDFQPVAYDVATGKEKWRGVFPTVHNLAMRTCDASPDGSTLLCMHGHRVARVDTATGTERDPPDGLSRPSGVTWSPDGKRLFTRADRHDRTWTAWDPTTGKRLYDLLPIGFVTNNEWKMMPDLFFINGGKELVAGLEKSEKTERVGPKEMLVFDAATGKPRRRLGNPLPGDRFQWAIPIAVEPDGSSVVMQVYAVSGPPGLPGGAAAAPDATQEYTFHTTRWDPVKKASLGEWLVTGNRLDAPRRHGPYAVSLGVEHGDSSNKEKKLRPAKVRCYSLADGTLAHEWTTGFAGIDTDRVQGSFLLTYGYEMKWIARGRTLSFTPQPPFAYDVWEIPTGDGVRVFELDRQATAVLGPGGQYVLRVRDDGAVDVHEPFVLKRAVVTASAPARPEQFEFAPDGGRVAVSLADTSVAVWDTAPWKTAVDAAVAKAVPTNLGPLWEELAADAPTGLRAARLLAAAGDKGVALLKSKLSARQAPAADRVARLIGDLDSAKFGVREKAEADLRDLGPQAEPFLQRALKANPSAEAAKRLEAVLAALAAHRLSPAEVRELRAVQALEWQGTPAAHELLAEWAKGDPAATLTRGAKRAER